jgi:hypothetical protein
MTPCINHGKKSLTYTGAWFEGKSVQLHRKVYCQAKGVTLAAIAGQVVRHACDNPCCINPAHLLLGSHGQNLDDAYQRQRRVATGEDNGRAVVTAAQVASLRAGTLGRSDFVSLTGVSNCHAGQILLGNKWKS